MMIDSESLTETSRMLYGMLIQAWNQQNAELMSSLLSEEVRWIGFDGIQLRGRQVVEENLKNIFSQYPTGRFVTIVREVRMLTPNVSLLSSVSGMVPRGYQELNPAVNSVQTMVATENDGQWKIELFQNTPAVFHGQPELAHELSKELSAQIRIQLPVLKS